MLRLAVQALTIYSRYIYPFHSHQPLSGDRKGVHTLVFKSYSLWLTPEAPFFLTVMYESDSDSHARTPSMPIPEHHAYVQSNELVHTDHLHFVLQISVRVSVIALTRFQRCSLTSPYPYQTSPFVPSLRRSFRQLWAERPVFPGDPVVCRAPNYRLSSILRNFWKTSSYYFLCFSLSGI